MAADRKTGDTREYSADYNGTMVEPFMVPRQFEEVHGPHGQSWPFQKLPQQACGDDMAGGHVGCHAGAADVNPCLRMPAGQGLTILVPCGVVRDHIKHTHEA